MPKSKRTPSRLTAWSYSRLETYETCPHQANLKFRIKAPEHPRPSVPGQAEAPNIRGSRIHELSEHVIEMFTAKIPNELRHFVPEYERLQKLYQEGRVISEEDWYFDEDWTPLPQDAYHQDIWLRVKIDILVWLNPHWLAVIDGKTGKRRFNEIKHGEQTQLYQLATFLRFKEAERVDTELWYFDIPELIHAPYTRAQGLKYFRRWDNRARMLTSDTKFEPRPSIHHCKFCPFKRGSNKWLTGTGECALNPSDLKTDDDEDTYQEKLAQLRAT